LLEEKKLAVERKKKRLMVVVPIACKKMWLRGCQVVIGHDIGEVNATTVKEEGKGWLVKKTGVGASFCQLRTLISSCSMPEIHSIYRIFCNLFFRIIMYSCACGLS
jgi:hypothetical protein